MEYLVISGGISGEQVGTFTTQDGKVVKADPPIAWALNLKFENVAYHCNERGFELFIKHADGGMPTALPYRRQGGRNVVREKSRRT